MNSPISKLSFKCFDLVWDRSPGLAMVKVLLPNLEELQYTMVSDWGPSYRFYLTKDQQIHVYLNDELIEFEQKELIIETPMYWKLREKFPLTIKIDLDRYGKRLEIYLDHQYQMGDWKISELRENALSS
ncbi:MAG: hypothetical protein OHK0056_25870 [Bacteriovoracaceae bacterium]